MGDSLSHLDDLLTWSDITKCNLVLFSGILL